MIEGKSLTATMKQSLEDICGAKLCESNSMSSRQEMLRLMDSSIASLRQAIKELESQEPVAWSYWQSCLNDDGTQTAPWVHRLSKFKPHESVINKDVIPLYTTPPQRTWVGLTDEEICMFSMWLDSKSDATVFTAIEARLKELNT